MSLATRALPADVLVALCQDLLDGLHRVAQVADLEGHVAQGRGGLGLRLLDLHLRELLLQPVDLVLELLLGDLRLAQVALVGLFGLGEFLRVGGQVGLEFLQLAGQAAGQFQVAGRWLARMRRSRSWALCSSS